MPAHRPEPAERTGALDLPQGIAQPGGLPADAKHSLHPVYLVGAGPGPLDLLTLKALRLLQQADVVIHDHLVGSEVLAAVRPGAELIFVGKRGGQFCRPQAEIEELLIEHGRSGKIVVRLKGGDPLIFGRGGEEAATLTAAGLAYEIVPGVTAALAAGAYSGIPLTHRAHSSAVVFLTGHENPEKADSTVPWENYGRLSATLCIYMGVRNLGSILGRLQAGGMKADMPAALVQSAATTEQRVLLATVGTLAERAIAEGFASPALAIIGPVAALAKVERDLSSPPESQDQRRYALIDNGSLAAAAHLNLRRVAAELSQLTGIPIAAVSWKHSDRIPPGELGGLPAWTVGPWIRRERERGAAQFQFIPFFISPQGAIGSALRRDLDALTAEHGGSVEFVPGLDSALPAIVADRIRQTLAAKSLPAVPVIVVDHGGPSPESAALRDRLAAQVGVLLGSAAANVTAASMESPDGQEFSFNRPLLAETLANLRQPGDVIIASLFLSPGRHAGPAGDLVQIARAAEAAAPGLRCHFTGLVGTHPLAVAALTATINPSMSRKSALAQP